MIPSDYEPLRLSEESAIEKAPPTQPLQGVETPYSEHYASISRRARLFGIFFSFSFVFNLLFIASFAASGWSTAMVLKRDESWVLWRGAKPVYSPAAKVLTHEHKLSKRFTQVSDYQGPRTYERDRLWASLYMPYSWVGVTRELAKPMLNQTERIQDDIKIMGEPRYILDLDVFHQLHCLDMIRRKLKGPREGEDQEHKPHFAPMGPADDPTYDHVDHCINSVREALMCNPDLTPVVWQWDEASQKSGPKIDVVHTCANFNAIQEWGKKWKLPYHIDDSVHVHDDWTHSPPNLGS
ncbi:hypothetical protein DL93DRAFT_102637 [Clavulina sp. PMI_390]|nr:hypothetical protein DL93DRAFT_102637 [Clavulina sp. PMI_390]